MLRWHSVRRPSLAAPRIPPVGGGGVNVVKNPEVSSSPTSGIPPDKEAEVQLLLQQRNPSTLKCYSDVLNEKHDRAFKGTVIVLLSLEPSGGQSKAADVKVIGGTMTDKEVTSCVVEKLKDFDYPEISADRHDAVRLPLRTRLLIDLWNPGGFHHLPRLSLIPSPRVAGEGGGRGLPSPRGVGPAISSRNVTRMRWRNTCVYVAQHK